MGKLVANISNKVGYFEEREVLFSPQSCFKYMGKDKNAVLHFQLVPWTENPEYGLYSRKNAIFDASRYYGRDYSHISDEIEYKGLTVKRPNHGLTHGVRSAYLTLDLMNYLSENEEFGELHEWSKDLLEKNKSKLEILFLMSLNFRAGRIAEKGNSFKEYEEHIKKVLTNSGLLNREKDVKYFSDIMKGNPSFNTNE